MTTNVLGSGADNLVIDGGVLQYNDLGGNDRYTLSPELANSGIAGPVVVNDTSGGIINLPVGLVIDTVTFSSTGVQITLGGINVQLVGTTNYSVNVAGDPLNSAAGNLLTLQEFAASLGSEVPASGNSAPVDGGTVLANGTLDQGGDPVDPTEPTNPTDPTEPSDPTDPTEPSDPTDPTDPVDPFDLVDLPEGQGALQTVNGVNGTAEDFQLDVVAARGLAPDTQIDLVDFLAAEDQLTVDLTAATGPTTLDQLNGVEGIAVQDDPFNAGGPSTLINFGPDADGDVIVLLLVGVADATSVNVNVI